MICVKIEEQIPEVPCNEYIRNLVIDEGLILSGHFQLSDNVSARDWVNLEGLFSLPNEKFIDPITKCMKKIIKFDKKDLCIIGVNYYGAILASILGYKYEVPFSYCFDNRNIVDSSEKEINRLENNKLLLIVDAMVYGDTICNLINSLYRQDVIGIETKIEIVVLFERKTNDGFYAKVYSNDNVERIYVLNDDFTIEICNKNKQKCLFRKNKKINKYKKQIT